MTNKAAERFVEALKRLEESGDVEGIASLFDENCEIGNVTLTDNFHGAEGARHFWTNYRETLGDVRSEFKNKILSDSTAAGSAGSRPFERGRAVRYEGVSILEMNGEKITRFFAYFDAGKLGDQLGGSTDGS